MTCDLTWVENYISFHSPFYNHALSLHPSYQSNIKALKEAKKSNVTVTMIYLGQGHARSRLGSSQDELKVLQQVNGGENMCVFKGVVTPGGMNSCWGSKPTVTTKKMRLHTRNSGAKLLLTNVSIFIRRACLLLKLWLINVLHPSYKCATSSFLCNCWTLLAGTKTIQVFVWYRRLEVPNQTCRLDNHAETIRVTMVLPFIDKPFRMTFKSFVSIVSCRAVPVCLTETSGLPLQCHHVCEWYDGGQNQFLLWVPVCSRLPTGQEELLQTDMAGWRNALLQVSLQPPPREHNITDIIRM